MRIAINIVAYQLAWWACILSARAEASWVGLAVTAAVLALHLLITPDRRREAWFVPLAAALGYAVDTFATLLGALRFEPDLLPMLPAPLWIAAMWLAFATTLNVSLAWLKPRLLLAAVLGAASGPLAYAAGVALDVVVMPNPIWSVVVLAVLWGATLPVLMLIAVRVGSPRQATGGPAEACVGRVA